MKLADRITVGEGDDARTYRLEQAPKSKWKREGNKIIIPATFTLVEADR